MEKIEKEASKIKATVMSLLFRSRPPRKLRRKSPAKARRENPASVFAPGAHLIPSPRAVPVPVASGSRRRRERSGYSPAHPRHAMFRVT